MNRRGFLGSILAAAAAPAIVRADSLMRIVPMDTIVITMDHAAGESWGAMWSRDGNVWHAMDPDAHGVLIAPGDARYLRTMAIVLPLERDLPLVTAAVKLYPRPG